LSHLALRKILIAHLAQERQRLRHLVHTVHAVLWVGGKWAGGGETDILPSAQLNLNDPNGGIAAYDLERELVSNGTVTWTKPADINVSNQGSINNSVGGVFDIKVGQDVTNGAGAGDFKNAGILRKSAGGKASIDTPVIERPGSDIQDKVGNLHVTKYVALNGNVEVDPDATLVFDGGVEQDGGTVTNTCGSRRIRNKSAPRWGVFNPGISRWAPEKPIEPRRRPSRCGTPPPDAV
jgi:hypothetical protein